MSKAIVFGWLAAAVACGVSLSAAVSQERHTAPGPAAAQASDPPATDRADAIVPPVRRVRPKSPSGPVAAQSPKNSAQAKGSPTVHRVAAPNIAARSACARGATVNRGLKRCAPKASAEAAVAQNGTAKSKGSDGPQRR